MILKPKIKIFIIVFSFVFSMQIIAQEDKEKSNKIILSQLENNNYQALVEDITNGDNIKNTVEYEMISKKSLNDFVKDNLVNQMYLGSITIIGLYVLYQILKREK